MTVLIMGPNAIAGCMNWYRWELWFRLVCAHNIGIMNTSTEGA